MPGLMLAAALALATAMTGGCSRSSGGGGGILPAPVPAGPSWTRITSPTAPSGRWGAAAVFDPSSGVAWLFGGGSGVNWLADLWAANLGGTATWTEVKTQTAPSGRWGHAMVLDPVHSRLVLFGGINTATLGDTWTLDLTKSPPVWAPLSLSGSTPPARRNAVAAYDPIRRRMLLFGGHDGTTGSLGDLWSLDLSTLGTERWTQLTPTGTTPPAREFAGAVFHAPTDRFYVFGGESGFKPMGDLWAFEAGQAGGRWVALAPAGGPSARSSFSMALDGLRHEALVLFGSDGQNNLADAWVLDVSDPNQVAWSTPDIAGTAPSARLSAVLVHDPARRRFVLQGGNDGSFNTETWSLAMPVPAWVKHPGPPGPTARFNHAAAYDPVGGRMVVHGGFDGSYLDDTWTFTTRTAGAEHWTRLAVAGPSKRFAHTLVTDGEGKRLVLFAGSDGTSSTFVYYNDVWSLDVSVPGQESWTRLTPTGTPPPPRDEHVAGWDATGKRLVIHGGFDDVTVFADAWTLDLSFPGGGSWVQLPAKGSVPPGLAGHAAAFDASAGRLLIHGGGTGTGWSAEVRALQVTGPEIGTWSVLGAVGASPPARSLHAMTIADWSGRLGLFGGQATRPFEDAWWCDPSAAPLVWSPVDASNGGPPALSSATLVADPVNRRLVVFGGLGATRSGDVWFHYPDGR